MFKIVLIGQPKTGKTTIFKNINGPFIYVQNIRMMLGADFYQLQYEHHNIKAKVSLWDINSHTRYISLYPQFIRGAKAVLVVFDVSNRQSFLDLEYWLQLTRSKQIEQPYGFLIGQQVQSKGEKWQQDGDLFISNLAQLLRQMQEICLKKLSPVLTLILSCRQQIYLMIFIHKSSILLVKYLFINIYNITFIRFIYQLKSKTQKMGKRVKQDGKEQIGKMNTKIQKYTKMPILFKAKSKCKLPCKMPIKRKGLRKLLKQRSKIAKMKRQENKLEGNNKANGNLKKTQQKQKLISSVCFQSMLKRQMTLCGNYFCQKHCQKQPSHYQNLYKYQSISSAHYSATSQSFICQICLDNLRISQESQQMGKHTLIQDLEIVDIVDYLQDKWRRGITIKINKSREIKTIVILCMDSFQLSQKTWQQSKFRRTQLLDQSYNSQQNKKKNRMLIDKIAQYWIMLQIYSKQNSQRIRKFLFINLQQIRQKLIKQMQLLNFYTNKGGLFYQNNEQLKVPDNFLKEYNNINSKWSQWLLYRLVKYYVEMQNLSITVNPCKKEQESVIDLQNQMRGMSIKENNQMNPQELILFSIQDSNDSIDPFSQFQTPNSMNNQPYSNGQQRIHENNLQQQPQFQHLYLS